MASPDSQTTKSSHPCVNTGSPECCTAGASWKELCASSGCRLMSALMASCSTPQNDAAKSQRTRGAGRDQGRHAIERG